MFRRIRKVRQWPVDGSVLWAQWVRWDLSRLFGTCDALPVAKLVICLVGDMALLFFFGAERDTLTRRCGLGVFEVGGLDVKFSGPGDKFGVSVCD
jgi:hypothetical protein